jgi:hypothetical protein
LKVIGGLKFVYGNRVTSFPVTVNSDRQGFFTVCPGIDGKEEKPKRENPLEQRRFPG